MNDVQLMRRAREVLVCYAAARRALVWNRRGWLDDKALRELLVRRGAHVTAAREGTVITFPDDAPLRARVIGRELSDALEPSSHRAP